MTFGILGYGRFGKLWAECLKSFGEVKIYDPKLKTTRLEETLAVDYLFILVPIRNFESVCKKIAKKVPPHTVVVDACSVKTHPSKIMLSTFSPKQTLIATHPLFGPDSVAQLGLAGRKMVLCQLRGDTKKSESLVKVFKKMKLEILECSPEEHDRQMARSQALVHFIGRGLAALKLGRQDLYTPDYEALRRIDSVVNNDTWQLFFDMQRSNPYASQVREKFLEKLTALHFEILDPGDVKSARKNIDQIDRSIIELLGKRFEQSRLIGEIKKQSHTEILDAKREKKLKEKHIRWAREFKVPDELVGSIFESVLQSSRHQQSKH